MSHELWTVYEGAALSPIEFFGVMLIGAITIIVIEALWPK